ncbi:hypothetical protein NSIN_40206 [Nitrosotalea sinensis]|jgi:hypothetical protein|uniref:Uncharacterized protein n=2 Tax=Nitrosotalea sinensis TaxID=1499975 RepID=A0A2H1EJL2_9ARCH|nr:hypothetical protein NSIN_40206 [Candidatus Nitrosotalea sinensis]
MTDMKFTASRKAIAKIEKKKIRQDLEQMISRIEKTSTNKEGAGRHVSNLIRVVASLENTLTKKNRMSVIESIFSDAKKAELPHQWERKEGYECDKQGNCSIVNPDKICYRDTWVPGVCMSG